MISLIIWFAALLCHNPNHTCQHHGNCPLIHVSTNSLEDGDDGDDGDDTGGETGGHHHPPPPPPPPPPGR